jgi:Fe-S-cluster containining protein
MLRTTPFEKHSATIEDGTGKSRGDSACLWLDMETRRCRHYEWRPNCCRDFLLGDGACLSWRKQFGIG